jgi:hypothetical protein
MPIPIIIVDRHFAEASALFNPNAFPARVKSEATSCGDRLAILSHSVEIVVREPALDRSRLLQEIRENKAFAGFTPVPDKPAVLVLHNLNFVSGLYSALIALKSFLDLYSRLIARSLVPSASVFGFGSGNYKRRNLSGGRFLRWIDHSAPRSFENRERLVAILLVHVNEWVDQAVTYRDAVVHNGYIVGMTEAMVPLEKALRELQETDVVLPMMPDGVAVTDYCKHLVRAARSLVSETLPLLPDVDLGLVSLDKADRMAV